MDSAEPKKMDGHPAQHEQQFTTESDKKSVDITAASHDAAREDQSERKRKRFGDDGRSGRGHKRKDMGRGEWQYESSLTYTTILATDSLRRNQTDRRARTEADKLKRQGDGRPNVLPKVFAQDEIDAEDRKPKRKVAVMVGYSGTGYKGMQM